MRNTTVHHEMYSGNDVRCWQGILSGVGEGRMSPVEAGVLFAVVFITSLSIIANGWCAIVIFANAKLRKPTWIFKASMAVKDIILSFSMAVYGTWNVIARSATLNGSSSSDLATNFINPVEFMFNVFFITCISSSFVHMLLICFDRHQVISRPFRYHTGELLPSKVACILIGSGWTFCFVIGLSVTSESLEYAERAGELVFTGTLCPLYRVPGVQKWLMGGGMALLYFVTVGLLVISLAIELNRKKTRKARLLSGAGDPEPLRSRNNSVCHVSKITQSAGFDDGGNNSETEANDFLLNGGFDFAGLRPLSGAFRNDCEQEVTIFTPVNYRPSLLRRIRDTWSLYSANFCFINFTIMAAIPFLVLMLIETPTNVESETGVSYPPTSYCIGSLVIEFLLLTQGIGYVAIYVIVDDVFRPFFTRPFKFLKCERKHRRDRVPIYKPSMRKDVRYGRANVQAISHSSV